MPKTNWLSEKQRRTERMTRALESLTGIIRQNWQNSAQFGEAIGLSAPQARQRRDNPASMKLAELGRMCADKGYDCTITLTRDGAETRIVL